MKAEDIDIKEISSIEDFHLFLDKNVLLLAKNDQLSFAWIKIKDHLADEQQKQLANWEVEMFLHYNLGKKLFSHAYSYGQESELTGKYPDLAKTTTEAFNYLIKRAEETTSSYLKYRYCLLAWKAPQTKNKKFADLAIQNAIQSIQQLYALHLENSDQKIPIQIGKIYETLLGLCNDTNQSIAELKSLSHFLLFETKNIGVYTRHGIINDMLNYPKLFKAVDLVGSIQFYEELKNNQQNHDEFKLAQYYYPTAIKIATKIKTDIKVWYEEIANINISLAEQETEQDRNFIKLDYYFKAIQALKSSGNKVKKKAIEQLYSELKSDLQLETITVDFDEQTIQELKKLDQELKENAKDLLKLKPEQIYKSLSAGSMFPKYKDTLQAASNHQPSFLDAVTTSYFDNNKNISKRTPEEEKTAKLFEEYGDRLKGTLLPYLHYVFVLGIKSGHLTAENLIIYLAKNTWIGIPHVKKDLGGEPDITNWIKLITPAIVEFFNQIQAWGESKYFNPSFILCIDSLTLKIEGLFRSFCERINQGTAVLKNKAMQETLLHNILDEEAIKKYFDQDDMLLFEYVFSSKYGMNLRNNIAHSFYSEREYHPNMMFLLLSILLRIGKYQFNKK